MRKQSIMLLPFAVAVIMGGVVWADPVDQPMAIVTLHSTDAIPQSQFKTTVRAMEKTINRTLTLEEKNKLLDNLINEKLIVQAAVKEKITVTDVEIDQYIAQTRKLYEEKLGRPMTDAEFKNIAVQAGYSNMESFRKDIQKMLMEQKYIKNRKGAQLANVPPPSDKEIMDYFYKYQNRFATSAWVRYKQIFINPNLLSTPAEKESARKKAEAVSREIKAGASFDNYWEIYDDTGHIKIGNLINGTLRRDDEQSSALFGDDYVNAIFMLKPGETSGVIASKAGYHIVQLLETFPAKLLGIDDLIPPQNSMTVRNYIKAALSQIKQQEAMQKALEEITTELRKTAVIKKFSENMNW